LLYEVGLQINTFHYVSIISMVRIKTRTVRYELRLTPVEKESWSVKAAAVGLDLSEYIRRCVERRQITTTIQPEVIATAKAVKSLCEAQLPLHPSDS